MSLRRRFARGLLGVLRWALPGRVGPVVDAAQALAATPALPIATTRKKRRRSRQPTTITRWLQADVETAQKRAGQGDLELASRLWRSLARDGLIIGLLGTLTGGLVRLPKTYRGSEEGIAYLRGTEGSEAAFEKHFPASELAKWGADAFGVGLAIGELIDTPIGPVFVRLDPEFLRYKWFEDRWYYSGINGEELITPGDGRWVLYLSSRLEPWNNGRIWALGRAYVSKEHAFFYRENWNAKLAHAARAVMSPSAATDRMRKDFIDRVVAWGVNTAFDLPPGWDVKVIEANGRGYESFKETIADANQEIMIAIAGQVVTITGGTGFANAGIHETIKQDIIDALGKGIGETLSEQAIPFVLAGRVANTNVSVAWDTRKPINRKEESDALSSAAKAITDLVTALAPHGLVVDIRALAAQFNVPLIVAKQAIEAAPIMATTTPANDELGEPIEAVETEAFAPADQPLENADAVALAGRMTELGIDRCKHGKTNWCDWCGIERVHSGVELDKKGNAVWAVEWRAIPQGRAA